MPINDYIAYYKFNNNLSDETGNFNGINGINVNVLFVEGKDGDENSAISFDNGNAYITLPIDYVTESLTDFTICFWLKTDSLTKTNGTGIMQWANDVTSGSPMVLLQARNSTTPNKHIITPYVIGQYFPNIEYNLDEWTFVSIIYSSNTYYLFINEDKYTVAIGNANTINADKIYFGNGYNGYTNDNVDEVRIYDRALSDSEITDVFNYSPTPDTPTVTSTTPNYTGFPTWSWNSVDGAISYRYSYDESTWTTTTNTSFTPVSQLADGTYTLYVQSTSDEVSYSASGSFEVTVTSDVPEPVISVSLDSNNNPIITWSSITGVTNYQIYRYTAGNSEYSASDEANFAANATIIATTASTSYIDTSDLDYDTVYYYAVKANAE